MTTEAMREWVLAQYPGKTWREKVAKMDDRQVTAVYLRMQREGT